MSQLFDDTEYTKATGEPTGEECPDWYKDELVDEAEMMEIQEYVRLYWSPKYDLKGLNNG